MEINPIDTNGQRVKVYLFDTSDPQFFFQLNQDKNNKSLSVEFESHYIKRICRRE